MPTLGRVCATWRDLRQYCGAHDLMVHSLSALQVAPIVAKSNAPK